MGDVRMIAGYHTAGLLLHDPCVAVSELAHLGFGCVAVRPHPVALNPTRSDFSERMVRLTDACQRYHMRLVLDLDAPFFHDPWQSRGPSLASCDPSQCDRAFGWIAQWLDLAPELPVQWITFASGHSDGDDSEPPERELERLGVQLERVAQHAAEHEVHVAVRPRSGDAIATVAQFERLGQWLSADSKVQLAADVGEMLLGSELPVADRLARNLDALACVYLCDRKAGKSGDQPIGQGDVALIRILRSLRDHQFAGPAIARVEGHSELGFSAAQQAAQLFESVSDG